MIVDSSRRRAKSYAGRSPGPPPTAGLRRWRKRGWTDAPTPIPCPDSTPPCSRPPHDEARRPPRPPRPARVRARPRRRAAGALRPPRRGPRRLLRRQHHPGGRLRAASSRQYVRTRFPQWDVRFHNAGVGGDTVRGGGAGPVDVRLERDVIALEADRRHDHARHERRRLQALRPGDARDLRRRVPGDRRDAPAVAPRRAPHLHPLLAVRRRRASAPASRPATTTRSGASGCYVTVLGAKEKATVVDFRDARQRRDRGRPEGRTPPSPGR